MSRRDELNAICRMLGNQIAAEMADATSGPPMGFMLMTFDFGPGGFVAYVSNAQRADMVKALREQADRLEAGETGHTAQA